MGGLSFMLAGVSKGYATLLMPKFDAGELLPHLQNGGLTGCFLVPTMISALLEHPQVSAVDYPQLRSIVYGAAPMTPALLERAMRVFRCDFMNTFGAGTEAGTQTLLSAADHRRALAGDHHLLGSIGRAGFGVELRLCDDDLKEVDQGQVGEVVTRSETVMSGYLGMPEETAQATPGGWFRGGDLARMDAEGYLYLAGRSKDMIIRGGENIYPVEIEAVLSRHPDIVEVAVAGVPDDRWGEVVHAWVVSREGLVNDDQLRDLCRPNLASYKHPIAYHYVTELPKNAAGKIVKGRLPGSTAQLSQAQAQPPSQSQSEAAGAH
jgi:acyl-CoA synthetase (AMP-forming)/AMP-acid ligase II